VRIVEEAFASLFAVTPLNSSFKNLVDPKSTLAGMRHAVEHAIGSVKGDPCLVAAAYIYADDLVAAHKKVYDMEDNHEAAYWHGIIHRREGDFYNANYWFRLAGHLPASLGIDPIGITDRAQAFKGSGAITPSEALLEDVRKEFRALSQVGIDRIDHA
jgi:hypothetical protein